MKVVMREGSGGREIEKADLVGVNGVVVIHGKLSGERDGHAVDYYGNDEGVNNHRGEVACEWVSQSWSSVGCGRE